MRKISGCEILNAHATAERAIRFFITAELELSYHSLHHFAGKASLTI